MPEPTDDALEADRAYDARDWRRAAELWRAIAATREGERRGSALSQAACCLALDGQVSAAFTALADAVDAGMYDLERLGTEEDLAPLRADPRWPALVARAEELCAAWERSLPDPDLRHELLGLARLDQAARRAVMADWSSEVAWAQVEAIDRRTTARMTEIARDGGWPGRSRVGRDGAHAAWLLVQHADHDLALQKQCLALLERAVTENEATASDHAYLADRVAVAEGRPQRHGTQLAEGFIPQPLEDESEVDARRRAVGLMPLADYLRWVRSVHSKPPSGGR